jgi:hypothetical protein
MKGNAAETIETVATVEVRLWQAVIVNAVEDWISGPLPAKGQAEEYLFNDQHDFQFVCLCAGMDAGQLRIQLTKLRNETAANRSANSLDRMLA